MAENETLDLRNSLRWVPVIRSIRDRVPSTDVQRLIMDTLSESWGAIKKQFRKAGFSLQEVLKASAEGDLAFLDMAYGNSKYHRFVRLIRECKDYMDSPHRCAGANH